MSASTAATIRTKPSRTVISLKNNLRLHYMRLIHASPERRASRALLSNAKKGDFEQYLALASHYVGLVQAFYGNTLHEPAETRMARTGQLFIALWHNLRYAKRLSDFEYMLAEALINSGLDDGPIISPEPLIMRIRMLSPRVRFAFLANELDQWPVRWVALVLRIRSRHLHQLLAEARCELCGFSWDSLSEGEQSCLQAISASLEYCPKLKHNIALCKRIHAYPRVGEIKAHWLEMRPQLVEVRHRYLPPPAEDAAILRHILSGITETAMVQPRLVDHLVNSVHFSRRSQIKVS
jgi:hypothetical protein